MQLLLCPELGLQVKKLMLSHNRLNAAALAASGITEPGACHGLEMLRLANNDLEAVSDLGALLRHPTLAWLALGGNPCSDLRLEALMATTADAEMAGGPGGPAPVVPFASITVDGDKVLGAGPSGTVCECRWSGQTAAPHHSALDRQYAHADGPSARRREGGFPDARR